MFASHYLVLALMLTTAPRLEQDATNPAVKDFNAHVQAYWNLHKKVESGDPSTIRKKEPDPAVIIEHQRQVATGIREARLNAAEQDIFKPDVQKIFIETINRDLSSSQRGAKARDIILGEGNPKNPESAARIDLKVNATYPSGAPLSSVPPSVLLTLPKLPDGLEYRFVGRHLILYDEKANLIVDILRNVVR